MYIKCLEEKIEQLEAKVEYLSSEIDKYRYRINMMAIGGSKDLIDFKELEEHGRDMFLRELKKGNLNEKLIGKFKNIENLVGSAGSDRQNLIKAAIRVIIENILPARQRITFAMYRQGTHLSYEEYRKLFELDEKSYQIEVQDPRYTELDKLRYETRFNPKCYKKYETHAEVTKHFAFRFQKCIHNLIKARNSILKTQNEFRKFDNPNKFGCSANSIIKFFEYTKRLEQDKIYDIYHAWDIPKRTKVPILNHYFS